MCLILTLIAAFISSLLWYKKDYANTYKIGTLSLMFWGASLMWLVDSVFAVFEGEAFFDLSVDDAKLGALIVLCGIVAWVFMLAFSRSKQAFSKA